MEINEKQKFTHMSLNGLDDIKGKWLGSQV